MRGRLKLASPTEDRRDQVLDAMRRSRAFQRPWVDLVLRQAFGPMHLHRIEANVQPANLASRSLVESLGFRLEGYSERYLKIGGRWRDHERWAILAESRR